MENIDIIVEIILCILSFILALVSVVIVIITYKQNAIMIENSSRAYISVFGDVIDCQSPAFYLVLKNFGQSNAFITSLKCDTDLSRFSYEDTLHPFSHIENTSVALGQSFKCTLDPLQLFNSDTKSIQFNISYMSNNKIYHDEFLIKLDTFSELIHTRADTKNNELKIISYALQELNERLL